MKEIFNSKLLYLSVAMAGLCLTSCSSDSEVDPYDINYCYTSQPGNNSHDIAYLADGTIVKGTADIENTVVARCTKPAQSDIKVTYSIDKSLVETFNKTQKTPYEFLESAELAKPTLTIKAGKYISDDTLKVQYKDQKEFANGKKYYVVPITIKEADGDITLSEKRVFYLVYNSQEKLTDIVTTPVGTVVGPAKWSLTVNGVDQPSVLKNLSDEDPSTDTGKSCSGKELIFNFGEEININTLLFGFYNNGPYYSADTIELSYSSDGKTYTDVNTITWDRLAKGYLLFYSPFKAQYLKIVTKKADGGSIYLSTFKVYKK